MAEPRFALDYAPPLVTIAFTRPAEGNRINHEWIAELETLLDSCRGDPSIRAVILTGEKGVFSLGWDATYLQELRQAPDELRRRELLGGAFASIASLPLPVFAAINGDALSAGLELALACDVRFVAAPAHLGFPDVAGGRLPCAGGTQRLARIAGRAIALEMILTAGIIDAGAALAKGLVSAVVEPDRLLEATREQARLVSTRGPLAVRLAKEAVNRGMEMPLEQALRFETDLTILLQTTQDRAEGVAAFKEKRAPRFKGQ